MIHKCPICKNDVLYDSIHWLYIHLDDVHTKQEIIEYVLNSIEELKQDRKNYT